jgi:hypothetical protein
MPDPEEIAAFAVIFLFLFFVGGIVGHESLPAFPGRFFVSGLIVAIFGTGAGSLVLKFVLGR